MRVALAAFYTTIPGNLSHVVVASEDYLYLVLS